MKATGLRKSDAFEMEKHLREFCEISSEELGIALGTVLGEIDYALSSRQPQVRERSMLVALAAVEQAIALSRNLRYFSLHTRLEIQCNDLTNTLLDTVDLIERELEFKNIQISVRAESGLLMDIDAAAIGQAILNLMIFSAHGMVDGGKLSITLSRLKDSALLRLEDSGKTFSDTEMENLFIPYRGPGVKSNTLGLTVARTLVESHGGEIRIESKPGHGNIFTIKLPIVGAKKAKPPREIRKYRRVSVHIPVTLVLDSNHLLRCELSILSTGGCFARLPTSAAVALPKVNDKVTIRIHYFGEDSIEISQTVVKNLLRAGTHTGIGLEFGELSDRASKILAAIVRTHAM